MSKCFFALSEVHFLGHMVGKDGLKVDLRKTAAAAAVQDWPVPADVSQVRSFLGLANYFRRFVARFDVMARPLTVLTRKTVPWNWGQKAFDASKQALTDAPVLALLDFSKPGLGPFRVVTDASGFGLGAILLQDGF